MGAGGLVRAYSHAASLAIEAAGKITYEPYAEYELVCGYADYQKYNSLLMQAQVLMDGTEFGAEVCIRFAVKRSASDALLKTLIEAGNGKLVPREVGERLDYR